MPIPPARIVRLRRSVKERVRGFVIGLVRKHGTMLCDAETGASLGRALLIPWGGKIHIIGLQASVRPYFLHQTRLTYWKQELGFVATPAPDYPHEPDTARGPRS